MQREKNNYRIVILTSFGRSRPHIEHDLGDLSQQFRNLHSLQSQEWRQTDEEPSHDLQRATLKKSRNYV